mgnify:CR=1 FL=1
MLIQANRSVGDYCDSTKKRLTLWRLAAALRTTQPNSRATTTMTMAQCQMLMEPMAEMFPARNRIISGLARAVVVDEPQHRVESESFVARWSGVARRDAEEMAQQELARTRRPGLHGRGRDAQQRRHEPRRCAHDERAVAWAGQSQMNVHELQSLPATTRPPSATVCQRVNRCSTQIGRAHV